MKNPYLRIFSISAFFLSVILLNTGCKKSPSATTVIVPVVVTPTAIINVTSTTAQSGGVITYNGNAKITANGICYSTTNTTPTISDSKTSDPVSTAGTVSTNFTSNLTGLTAGTVYYIRAYATNSVGTGYGNVVKFTTSADLAAVVATVTTFAGDGTAGLINASGLSAEFNNPQGLSVDNSGNIFVSDSYNSIIRKITPAGDVSTFAGNGLIGYSNGPAATAQFYDPQGSVFDAQGDLYVADLGNNVIRKITPAGIVSTFAGTGTAGYHNGAADSSHLSGSADSLAQFNAPQGLAIDAQGNIYVADRGNNVIREISPAGRVITLAGNNRKGYIDATGTLAYFNGPTGVAVDAAGNVYVADLGNEALRKVTPAGVVTTLAGGPAQPALVDLPAGITIDKQGNLYITDEYGRVLQYTANNVLYILDGTIGVSGLVNGTGASVKFFNPQGITVDANGNIYVADQNNNVIRKITISLVP
jgi:sugar lactone lactonase YvrE